MKSKKTQRVAEEWKTEKIEPTTLLAGLADLRGSDIAALLTALDALSRLETIAAYADVNLPHRAIQLRIGNFADLFVHVVKKEQWRFVSEVIRVERFHLDSGRYDAAVLYQA